MPFSLIASVVSHCAGWNAVFVKQPSVVNSDRPNASRFTHGGGGSTVHQQQGQVAAADQAENVRIEARRP